MKRSSRPRGLLFSAAIATALLVTMVPIPTQAKPPASLASGGLDGSLGQGMQPVDLPARVARVAVVPGTGGSQAWAIGRMSNASADWAENQTVFLRFRQGEGWSVYGPPRDENGAIVKDLILADMSFASLSEGWAVGALGALVKYTPQRGWIYSSACLSGPLASSCPNFSDVSVVEQGSTVIGFAVGNASQSENAILRYSGDTWSLDDALVVADPSPTLDFYSVSTVDADTAWAVGGTSSRELQIFRRDGLVWQRQRTNKLIFDNPAPTSNEGTTVNLSAIGWSIAAAADGRTAWIGGGIAPVDPGSPVGSDSIPFTLRWQQTSGWKSFCPPQYSLYNDNASIVDVCDGRMPLATYDIDTVSLLPNGEVFAGGLGLFHFKDEVWWREPNSNAYLSSISFFAPSNDRPAEGWVASSGAKLNGGGNAVSSSSTLGHFTATKQVPRTAAWPHYNRSTLYGIATGPSGRALAVGDKGAVLIYKPGIGWDRTSGSAGSGVLRSVAWDGNERAWVVGDRGVVAIIENGNLDVRLPGTLTTANLASVAITKGRGYAVGERGTILSYTGGGWSMDPLSGTFGEDLLDITPLGEGFAVVGKNATVLINRTGTPGEWSRDQGFDTLLASTPGAPRPSLFAVSATRSGTLVLGGAPRIIAMKRVGEPYTLLSPIDSNGTVLDLQASSTASGGLEVFALMSNADSRFRARRSTLMHFDGSDWRDIELSATKTTHLTTDVGGTPDPALSLSLDSNGRRGWAAGGIVDRLVDELGNYYTDQASAIYRFDLEGDPRPPSVETDVRMPSQGFNFAYFSESSCGNGYCSVSVGSGTRADRVALAIRDEINDASRKPNGPKFAIFGGNMRASGLPDELEEFRGYLSDFRIPVFAALGPQDLFSSGAGNQAQSFVPELPDEDLRRAGLKPPDVSSAIGSNRFFLRTFAREWEPWGTGAQAKKSPLIDPVDVGLTPELGMARTHYAFDYAPGGRSLARFVILDSSDHLYSKQAQSSQQNPPNQDQATWLSQVVADAKTKSPPLPVIVATNVPSINPLTAIPQRTLADGDVFESSAFSLGISAVLSGYVRANAKYLVPATNVSPNRVPFFVMGSGGAPPISQASKYPNDGHYHSWGLINVDTRNVSLTSPQALVTAYPIPIVESVSLNASDGLIAEGGWPLLFKGLARGVMGGATPSDPQQNRMAYLEFPTAIPCFSEGLSPGGFCLNRSAMPSDYSFESESPEIAQFVKPGPLTRHPWVENGFLIPDDKSGFLCTFKVGTAWVKLVAGGKQMRMPVRVNPGFGPCVEHPILPAVTLPEPRVPHQLETPGKEAISRPFLHSPSFPESLVIVLPPVPAPIAAPAPPASAAGSRKEEEEAQFEEQGDEGEAEVRVLGYQRRSQTSDPIWGWVSVATAGAAGLMLAFGMASVATLRRRRTVPVKIYVE